MSLIAAAVPDETLQVEVGIEFGIVRNDAAAEQHQVERRGALVLVRQARGVDEIRVRHAEFACLGGHARGELVLGAAETFGDGDGDIVGGANDDCLDGFLDGQFAAGLKAEARRILGGGVGRCRDLAGERDVALLKLLEQQVEGHHLRERGRIAFLSRHALVEHLARVRIDDDRGTLFDIRFGCAIVAGAVMLLARRICRRRCEDHRKDGEKTNEQVKWPNAPNHVSLQTPLLTKFDMESSAAKYRPHIMSTPPSGSTICVSLSDFAGLESINIRQSSGREGLPLRLQGHALFANQALKMRPIPFTFG